jgi:hypothetical protein
MVIAHDGEGTPCPRCLTLAVKGKIDPTMVMPLHPDPVRNPMARDGTGHCCQDCASADTLVSMCIPTFEMARVAVGNDREDQFRLPGVPMGLVLDGLVRPSAKGDFDRHWNWLEQNGLWPHAEEETEAGL